MNVPTHEHWATNDQSAEAHKESIDRHLAQSGPGILHRHAAGEACNERCHVYPAPASGQTVTGASDA